MNNFRIWVPKFTEFVSVRIGGVGGAGPEDDEREEQQWRQPTKLAPPQFYAVATGLQGVAAAVAWARYVSGIGFSYLLF